MREAAERSKRHCTDSGFVPQLGCAEEGPVYPNLGFVVGLSCSSLWDRAKRNNFPNSWAFPFFFFFSFSFSFL